MHAGLTTRTLLQFAFDRASYEAAPVSNVRVALTPVLKNACDNLHDAVADVWKSLPGDQSLSDALLLNVPATPNVFLMHWDVVNSTSFAKADYPIFRQYLNVLKKDFDAIIKSHGGELLRSEGDGQWFTFDTENAPVDEDLRKMALSNVIEAARALIQTHQKQLAKSGFTKPYLRCTVGLGYLEQGVDEKTGPLFWDVAKTSKSASLHKNSILMTPDLRDFLYSDKSKYSFKSNEISLKPF